MQAIQRRNGPLEFGHPAREGLLVSLQLFCHRSWRALVVEPWPVERVANLDEAVSSSCTSLLDLLASSSLSMEFRRPLLAGNFAKGQLQHPTGFAARAASKALGFQARLSLWRDKNLDRFQESLRLKLDSEFDGTVGQRLFGDRVSLLAGFELSSLHRIRLQEAVKLVLRAPAPLVIIELDRSLRSINDNGVSPAGEIN